MKRYESKPLRIALLAASLLLAAACSDNNSDSNKSPTEVGTETNWLQTCEADVECGSFSCLCGVCTDTCTTDSQCSMSGAQCSAEGEPGFSEQCGETTPDAPGLCLGSEATSDDVTPDDQTETPDASADDTANDDQGGNPDDDSPNDDDGSTADVSTDDTPNDDSSNTDDDTPNDDTPAADDPDDSADSSVNGDASEDPDDAGVMEPTPTDGGAGVTDLDAQGPTDDAEDPNAEGDADTPDNPDDAASGELLSGYLMWDRPGGVAGTGPIVEVLPDGTIRFWDGQAMPFAPHESAGWQMEQQLTPEQLDELVRLLLAVDYSQLPHEDDFQECYPRMYFEPPSGEPIDISYGGASELLPEMQEVYEWFDAYVANEAPDYFSPSTYCPDSP